MEAIGEIEVANGAGIGGPSTGKDEHDYGTGEDHHQNNPAIRPNEQKKRDFDESENFLETVCIPRVTNFANN